MSYRIAGIEPRAAGTQEGFPGCRTPGKATGGPGVDSELCARCRAASVADGDAQEVPVDARSRASPEDGTGAVAISRALAEGETNPAALAALAERITQLFRRGAQILSSLVSDLGAAESGRRDPVRRLAHRRDGVVTRLFGADCESPSF